MEYYEALQKCADRYFEIVMDMVSWDGCEENRKLLDFVLEFNRGVQQQLPLMKLNRWLGYIQGVLIERHQTTVEVEQDWTRPVFRHLDFTS